MSQRDCPSREQMAAYLSGSLEEAAAGRLESHLETCTDCQAALQTLSNVFDTVLEHLRAQPEDSPYVGEPECQRAIERAAAAVRGWDNADPPAVPRAVEALPAALAQLQEYQVLEKLGRGGMGAVYKALHTRLGRNVAIKVLLEGRALDEQAVARFLREMKAVGGLSHPNIVQAHDAREVGGTHVLVMEHVDGLSLLDVLRCLGPLPVADACEVTRQAAAGLDYAHRQGLVHRDVKPTNLMLDRQGRVKILDLGLALLASDRRANEEITVAGQVMGTADYMAPEQVNDSHNVDARADIYSLGCALYALLTGRPPFHAASNKSVVSRMLAHLHEEPTPIGEVRPGVPTELAAVLGRMMAKRPDDRFATADDVRRALLPFCPGADLPGLLARASAPPAAQLAEPAAQPEPLPHTHTPAVVPSAKPAEKQRKLRPTAALVATAALFAVVVLGIVIKIRTQDGQETTVNVAPGSTVTIKEDDKPEVVIPEPGEGKTAETQKPAALKIEPEPPATQVGEPLSSEALVAKPAQIPGVRSWTIETRGHRGPVNATAVQPGGKLFASGGHDGSVRIWETATGRLLRVLVGAGDAVPALAWSPDGAVLAFIAGKQLQLWDAAAGKRLRTLTADDTLWSLAWSPQGNELAAGQDVEAKIYIWDSQTWILKKSLRLEDPGDLPVCVPYGLGWLPAGRLVVAHCLSNGAAGQLLLWDTADSKPLHREKVEGGHISLAPSFTLAPDGVQLLMGGTNLCHLWKIESDRFVKVRDLEARPANGRAAFSADSKSAIRFGTEDRRLLRLFDLVTGKIRRTIDVPLEDDDAGVTLADEKTLICAGAAGELAAVDLQAGQVLWHVPGTHSAPKEVAWSPDGKSLAVGYINCWGGVTGQARVISMVTGMVGALPAESFAAPWQFPTGELIAWLPSGDGGFTIGAPLQQSLHVWDRELKSVVVARGTGECQQFAGLTISRDGGLAATGATTGKNRTTIWDTATRQPLRVIPWDGDANLQPPTAHAFSPDAKLLAVARGPQVDLMDVQSGKRVRSMQLRSQGMPVRYRALAFSPDGKLLVGVCGYTGSDTEPQLWDVESGEHLAAFKGQAGPTTVAWLRDGKTIVTGGMDRTLRFWDSATGTSVRTVPAPFASVLSPGEDLAAGMRRAHVVDVTDAKDGHLVRSFVALRDGKFLTLTPDGHYVGSARIEREIVYVVETDAGQEMLTPDEFASKYGWKNDPTRVALMPAGTASVMPSPTPAPTQSGAADVPASTPPAPKADSETERRLAQFALSHSAWIDVGTPEGDRRIHPGQELPSGSIRLLSASLAGERVTDDAIRQLSTASNLRALEISFTNQLSDGALEHLANLRNLQVLRLVCSRITDQGLQRLSGLKSLSNLVLRELPITDASLESLARLPALAQLDLQTLTGVTGSGLMHFQSHPRLVDLYMVSLALNDTAMEHVGRIQGLRTLSLMQIPVSDAGLERLKGLTNLAVLNLMRTKVTSEGMRHLQDMKSLVDLDLSETAVGDDGLKYLEALPILQTVRLNGTAVTDEGTKYLGAMTTLGHLGLHGTQVGDAGLRHLAGLPNLAILHVTGTRVTDEGLRELKKMTVLGGLYLPSTITSEGLRNLGSLPKLAALDLAGARVTDAAIEHLIAMPMLTNVNLPGTRISAKGIATLKTAMPKTQVVWSEPNRTVAESVIAVGGSVSIRAKEHGEQRLVKNTAELPSDLFQVSRVHLAGVGKPLGEALNSLTVLIDPQFDRLESVDLSRTKLGDSDFPMLARLTTVVELSLAETQVTDQGLAQWTGMPKLRRLVLDGVPLRGPGLAGLKNLPALSDLQLACPTITDFACNSLAELKGLKRLSLATSAVTDEGLVLLGSLQDLEELDLSGTKATPQGVDTLRGKLPKCRVLLASPSGKQ